MGKVEGVTEIRRSRARDTFIAESLSFTEFFVGLGARGEIETEEKPRRVKIAKTHPWALPFRPAVCLNVTNNVGMCGRSVRYVMGQSFFFCSRH